jgi:hypothetical protein
MCTIRFGEPDTRGGYLVRDFRFSCIEMRKPKALIAVAALFVAVAVPAVAHAGEIRIAATPSVNTTFSGSVGAVPGFSGGTISFFVSGTGRIMGLTLKDIAISNFDCGNGSTISSSGNITTYSWTDGLAITDGRFSISYSGLDWDGVFDSATSVRGNIRLSVQTSRCSPSWLSRCNCPNRPQSATWSAGNSNEPVVTKVSIARTPNKPVVSYTRRSGVAKFTLSALIKDGDSRPIANRRVYLQTSTNGRTWTTTYGITTSSAGKAAKAFAVSTKQVRYYRWYVLAKSPLNLTTYSAATKVIVK